MDRCITLILICLLFGCSACVELEDGANREGRDLSSAKYAMLHGTPDASEAHRAVVGLYAIKSTSTCKYKNELYCTGTLVHPNVVITAAHCVTREVKYGETYADSTCNRYTKISIGATEAEAATTLYDVASIIWHPDYRDYQENKQYSLLNDIAVLKLSKPVPESVAKPIPILLPWQGLNASDEGSDLTLVGFGYDEKGSFGTKASFKTPLVHYCGTNDTNHEQGCLLDEKVYVNGCHPNPTICLEDGYQKYYESVLMPAGSLYYTQEDGGPCQGDSGGPAFITREGKEYLVGVTSYGDMACLAYGVSTAVQDHFDWILAQAPEIVDQYPFLCENEFDDDNDGLTDCQDPKCAGATVCKPTSDSSDSNGSGSSSGSSSTARAGKCNNKIDDNNNGLTDCEDPACADYAVCKKKDSSSSSSGCDTTPRSRTQAHGVGLVFFVMMALFIRIGYRRRKV